jgi:AcrR family transcriptional regulator
VSTSKSPHRVECRPKRSYHHGDLRKALIDATLKLLSTTGVRELSLREVSRTAGVSHAASYRHFQNKESLLAAVAQQGFDLLAEAMRSSVRFADPDPIAKLQAAGVAYVDFGLQHPQHLTVMFSGAIANFDDHPGLKAAAKAAQDELRAVVRAVSQGVAMGAAEEDTVGAAAWAIVHGLTVLLVDGQLRVQEGGRVTKQRQMKLASAVTALFCKGLQGLLRRA